jgi:hypothetical protein
LAAMQYNEILARRIVPEVARSSVDGGTLQPVMLHEVARRLKIDEASAEAAMYRAVYPVLDLNRLKASQGDVAKPPNSAQPVLSGLPQQYPKAA